MSVGHCHLIEALLEFFKMDNVNESPNENSPWPSNDMNDDEKKNHVMAVLNKFLELYIFQNDDEENDDDDNDDDGVLNYAVNLLTSFMVLQDCKDAVASGNGEHLALVQKQMLFYFSSVSASGFNSNAIEMLLSSIQNNVLLCPAEAHQCKWAALANWKGGNKKNIEIDLLQENRNKDIKGLIRQMGANKTEKAIQSSKAAGGVAAGLRKIVDVFEDQALIKPKSSAHSHKSSSDDEKKILADLRKLKPFSHIPG